MDPYAVLGVVPDASSDDIRRAYVTLARQSHPDVQGSHPAAEERMRELNQAWALLSDTTARADYDRRHNTHRPARGATTPADPWQPYDKAEDGGFDERDDHALSRGGLPTWLRLAPPVTFVVGVLLVVVGGFVGLLALVALGAISLLASVLLFVVAPLVALTSSRRDYRR